MLLNKSTRQLVATMGEAIGTVQCDYAIKYTDAAQERIQDNAALAKSNGVAEVQLLPAPADNQARDVTEIIVHNTDTITHNVFIYVRDGATYYCVRKLVLTTRQTANYTPVNGWTIG